MFSTIDTNRDHLKPFLPWVDFTKTLKDSENYIKKTIQDWDTFKIFDYAIFVNGGKDYVGGGGVHTLSWVNRRAEFGYWISKEFEGKGYISEFVNTLAAELFKIGFNRLEIRCNSANTRSSALAKNLNFHCDGCLRKDTIEQGKFRDTLVYSKLKEDHS